PVLGRTRQVRWEGAGVAVDRDPPAWLTTVLAQTDGYGFEFWPHRGAGVGQPELIITLLIAATPLGRLLVEVKLDSGKSQLAEGEGEGPSEPRDPDQLSRYWRRLRQNAEADGVPALGVVYLTAHAVPPLGDLTESLGRQPGDWLG